jgi:hypothetical protein
VLVNSSIFLLVLFTSPLGSFHRSPAPAYPHSLVPFPSCSFTFPGPVEGTTSTEKERLCPRRKTYYQKGGEGEQWKSLCGKREGTYLAWKRHAPERWDDVAFFLEGRDD